MGSIVKMQQDLGLDPMITTYSQHIGEHEIWPRMLFPRPFETDTWDEKFHVSATGEGWREHTHLIKTPDGDLDYTYRTEDGFGTSCHDYLLKGDEPERSSRRCSTSRPATSTTCRSCGAWSRRSATRPGGSTT